MDEIAAYNQARWKALAEADALFTRPKLNLDRRSAQKLIDPDGRFGAIAGKDVLCLASGGGQQSAAFAILGANVTVLDLSAEQLTRDEAAAAHYAVQIRTVQGDMRDLSCFEKSSFDIVFHPYSVNFVPRAEDVFRQVAEVIRGGGIYHVVFANPFVMGVSPNDWNGSGYLLKNPYVAEAQISYDDQNWVYNGERKEKIPNPVEYRHTLSEILNSLIENGFTIFRVSDQSDMSPDLTAAPATWDHLVAFAPPWIHVWAFSRPEIKN